MDHALRCRILLITAIPVVAAALVLCVVYAKDARVRAIDESVGKARAITLAAESAREEMGDKWAKGLFEQRQLRTWARQGEIDKVMAAVPVVTAWMTAKRQAEAGGYTFRVPKFAPRNPRNTPDEIEARVLKRFETEPGLAEHVEIDEAKNSVRYFRPIKLTNECLYCHGDPARSQELWGNSEGTDPTGGKMENWRAGDTHGAFEVIQSLDAADQRLTATVLTFGGIALVILVAGLAAAWWYSQSAVVRPLTRQFDTLGHGAGDVLTAATELANSSQQLAQSATEQAGLLERTSGSVDTVAQKARENADHSSRAAGLIGRIEQQVTDSNTALETMVASMREIEESSQRVARIIKTIDDFAFQTNVLALNAAVEAARAGEAGLGFAVVADEVRGLAMRSAEAARGTAELVENAIARTRAGSGQVGLVADAIGAITSTVTEARSLIDDVNRASQGQATEIQSVVEALGQIGEVTQSVAATAEESAAASEQLTAQARSALATVGRREATPAVRRTESRPSPTRTLRRAA